MVATALSFRPIAKLALESCVDMDIHLYRWNGACFVTGFFNSLVECKQMPKPEAS
jgi:hypothetical protein